MLQFKSGELPELPFRQAVKRPTPQKCVQIMEDFKVHTLEGVMQGKAGDYLMVGVRGELYVCDQDIFRETYELLPG